MQGAKTSSQSSIPFAAASRPQSRPASTSQRPAAAQPQRPASSTTRASGTKGGGSKLFLILIAAVVLIFGGKGLLGGDDGMPSSTENTANVVSSVLGGDNGSSSLGGLGNLLSSFMGSSGTSAYDFSGSLGGSTDYFSSLLGGLTASSGFSSSDMYSSVAPTTVATSGSSQKPDTTVAKGARDKFTTIQGRQKDIITLMVYMCGTDLESQNGMGTADLKEMMKATIGDNVNLIVYTGGCRQWRNNVISSSVNQIYQIKNGQLLCLEKDMGSAAMTKPSTLSSFIRYCAKNFPANRYDLIFWDHGGGSLSGYGHDEKNTSAGSMTLAGINTALKDGGVQFDFVGFDACLMATVENGLMLSQYADYMIGSEETEPGVGWYYTNWLTKLSANTSMKTVDLGKLIVDDFIDVCNQQCRGQGTTLSVVDLAELQATVPSELTAFSIDANDMIQNNEYATVSKARQNTREFAASSRIDQIDLIHFAKNLGTKEGEELAEALDGAIKYNRYSGGMSNAYGLSIYFPYKKTSGVNQAASTYAAIGMDAEYLRCIQEFASMEVSGQAVSSGYSPYSAGMYGNTSSYSSGVLSGLLGSLAGGNSYASSGSSMDMMDMLGSLFSGGSGSLSFFGGRTLNAEKAASYLEKHQLDASALVWNLDSQGAYITLADEQWEQVSTLLMNVFYDDGKGYVDLGMDNLFELDGNTLLGNYDGTWLSINGQPAAYYYLDTVENGDEYAITGYVPVMLNGSRANLLLVFDSERPEGYIAGAQPVYQNGETETCAKTLINIGAGDKLDFLCDYYSYDGTYQNSYYLGETMILGTDIEISNTPVGEGACRVTWCFTDLYQNQYWTPALTL